MKIYNVVLMNRSWEDSDVVAVKPFSDKLKADFFVKDIEKINEKVIKMSNDLDKKRRELLITYSEQKVNDDIKKAYDDYKNYLKDNLYGYEFLHAYIFESELN